jgi:hypothetical protein
MQGDDLSSPASILKQAIKAVPAVKYALGIAGIVASIAIISSFHIGLKVALLGTVVMLILMTVLVIFARLAAEKGPILHYPALAFAWGSLILVMAVAIAFFTSVVWGTPKSFRQFIESGSLTTPTPIPIGTLPIPTPNLEDVKLLAKKRQQSDKWERQGDNAAKDAIAKEYQIHQPGYQPNYSATESPSAPYKRINQSWNEADTDWQKALAIAADEHRIARLEQKLNHTTGKTCSDEKTENVFCYLNGTNSNVLIESGTRKVVMRR